MNYLKYGLCIIVLVLSCQLSAQTLYVTDSIHSKLLNENRTFWVQLPENYDPSSDVKYPVVYLLDGFSLQNALQTVYSNYWGHYLPHMILVGISNRNHRTRDLPPSKIASRRGQAANYETGGAEEFTQFIETELIPYIDGKFPTTPYRTLIGHSYAGLFTINMLLNHAHIFKNYIAIDPSLDWDAQKLLNQAKQKLQTKKFNDKSLFVSLAAEQLHMQNEKITIDNVMKDTSEFTLFPRSIIAFSNVAEQQTQNGLNFSWNVYPEDLHGTVPLPSIRDGLIFLFKWYQFKHPQQYNNPDTTVEELTELLKTQETIYKKHFGYSVSPMIEELFSGYGFMNLQMGAPKKAHFFFKMGIKYFPEKANSYDAMASYYMEQNDYANALKYATEAYKINSDAYHKEKLETIQEKLSKE